jgi:alpha-beta hydrolase superfamily lysophospholipase
MRNAIFSLLLAVISRVLILIDHRSGAFKRALSLFKFETERLTIASGRRRLASVFVSAGEDAPTVLICHGIGEIAEYWGQVQLLLQSMGISSLIFNYSGYGNSTGIPSAAHCEEDAIAACEELVRRGSQSIFLLGFSLGTGVATSVASRLPVEGLILCEGFSSLRNAAVSIGFPRWMTHVVPDIWRTAQRVAELSLPVLVMHSDTDDLFPLSMAKQVADASGERGQLIVLKGLFHNEPIFFPTKAYWGPVADWMFRHTTAARIQRQVG